MNGPTISEPDEGLAICLASSFFGYYAHLGFLNELESAGVRPGRISGASAGAMAGGLWARGLRGEKLDRVVHSLNFRRAFFDLGAFLRWPGIVTGLAGSGLLSGARMRRYLQRLWGTPALEELRSPRLEIAVTNLSRGQSEVRSHGPLNDFLIASCAMPVLFAVQSIGGEKFLDGGVALETPFGHWLKDPIVHTILVHRIRHRSPMKGLPWITPGAVMGDCHEVANRELFLHRKALADASGKRVIFCETVHNHPGLLHGGRSRGFFAAGAETARGRLNELREALAA